jgi:aldose 1-epimerase
MNRKRAKVEAATWQGENVIYLYAGNYEALLIPGVGANVIELRDAKNNIDILKKPDDVKKFKLAPQVYGIPILFLPNRIEDGKFRVGERTYQFPINEPDKNNHIHGFLHTRSWEVVRMEEITDESVEVELVFKADDTTDFYQYFPQTFECRLIYRLSTEGLEQEMTIMNHSDELIPLGLGYHTAFNVPFHPESEGKDYKVRISIGDKWELTQRNLPTGDFLPLNEKEKAFTNEGASPFGDPMDEHYTAKPLHLKEKDFHGAIIEDSYKKVRVVYEVDQAYKQWMIWNAAGNDGFVCLEPQTWIINAPNVNLPNEVTGFQTLTPGEKWEGKCKIFTEEM